MRVLITSLLFLVPMHVQAQKKKVVALAIFGQAAAWADMTSTQEVLRKGGQEEDPIAKPFVKLNRPEYYAAGSALTGGISLIGIALRHTRFHRVWWIPQISQIGINFGLSVRNFHWIKEH